MQFQQAKDFILDELSKKLPEHLCYHSIAHVLDVYNAAQYIGSLEHISEYDMQLLLTASLFHDAGFMNGSNAHEEESCRIANYYLPDFGYANDEIEKINGMIMATKIPQAPKNHLEQIICDADLDYLGRDDFFPISDTLYGELNNTGIILDEDKWNKLQVTFFESHHYFTDAALKLRQKKKEDNLQAIMHKITDNS